MNYRLVWGRGSARRSLRVFVSQRPRPPHAETHGPDWPQKGPPIRLTPGKWGPLILRVRRFIRGRAKSSERTSMCMLPALCPHGTPPCWSPFLSLIAGPEHPGRPYARSFQRIQSAGRRLACSRRLNEELLAHTHTHTTGGIWSVNNNRATRSDRQTTATNKKRTGRCFLSWTPMRPLAHPLERL